MLFMIFCSFQNGTPVPFEPFESAYRLYSDDYQKLAPNHLRPKTPDELSRTTQMENQRLSESEYKQNETKPLTKSLSSQPVEDNDQIIACEAASDVRSQPGDGASPVLVENDKGPQSRKGSLPSQSSNTTSHFTADGDTNSPSPAEGASDQSGLEISDDEGSQTLTDQKAEVSKDVLPLPIRVTENNSFDRDTTPAGTGSFSLRTLESAYSTDEEQLGLTAINNSNTSQSQSQSLTSGSGNSDPSDVATSSANTTSDQSPTTNDTATHESKDTVGRLIEQLGRKIEEKPNQAPVIQAKTPAKVEEPPKDEQQKDEKISVTVTDVTTGGTTTTGSATTSETHSSTSIGTTSLGSKYSSSAFILDETDHVISSAQPPMNSQTASLSPETKSSNDLSTVPEKQEKVHELPTPVEIQNDEPQKLVPGSENLAQGQTHPPEFGQTVPEEETVQMERVKQIRSSSPRAENNSSDPNMSSGGSVFTNQQFDQLSEDNSASNQNFVASQNTSKDSRSIRSGLENAQIRKGPDSSVGGTITPESLSDLSDPSSTTPDFADKTLVSDTRSPSEISRDDKGQRQRTLPYYDVSSSSKSKKYANVRNVGSNKSITKPVNEENQEDILADQNVPPEKMDNKESAALVASPSNRTQVSELQQQQDLNSKEGLSDGTTTFVKEPLTTKASDSASIRTAHLKRVRTGSKSKQSTPAPSLKSSMNIRTNADETSSVPESLTITASAISPINASTTGEVRKAELKTYESESNRQSEPVMRSIHEDSGEKRYLRRKSSGSLEYEYSFIGKHDHANLSGMSRNERSKILTDEEKYELDNRVLKVQIESPIRSDNKVATVETNSVISERNLDKNHTAYENLTATKGKESTDYFTDDKVGKLKPISLTLSSESEAIVSTKVSAEPKVISSEMELKREASGHKSQTSESWLDTETGDKIKLPASRKYVKTLDDMKNSDRSFMTESHRSSDQSQDQSESWLDTATGKSEYATSRNQMSQNAMHQNDNFDNDEKSVSAVRSKNTELKSTNSLVVRKNQNGFTKKLEDKNYKLEGQKENQSFKTKENGSIIETADFSEGQNKKATVGKTSSRTGSHQTQSRESLLDIKSTSYSLKSRSAVQSTASRSALRTVSTYDNSSNPTDTSVKSRTDQQDPVGNVEQTSQLDNTASRSAIHTLATNDKSSKLMDTSVKSRTDQQDPVGNVEQTSQLDTTASRSAIHTLATDDKSSKPKDTSVKSRTEEQDPTNTAEQTSQLGSTASRSALRTVSTYDGSIKPTDTSVKSRTNQQDPTVKAYQTSQLGSTASRSALRTVSTYDGSSKPTDTSVKSRTNQQNPTVTADQTSQLGSTASRSALRTVSTYDGSSKPTDTSVKSRTNQQDPTVTAGQTSQLGSIASRSALRTVSTYDASSKPTDTSVKLRTNQQDSVGNVEQTSQLDTTASRSAIHTLATNDKSSKLMDTSVKSRIDRQDPAGNVEQTSQLDTTASRSAMRTVSTYDISSKPMDSSVKSRTDQQDPAGNTEQTSQLDTTASRSAMRTVSTYDISSKPMDSSVKTRTDQQDPVGTIDQTSQLGTVTSRSAMQTISYVEASSKAISATVKVKHQQPNEHLGSLSSRSAVCTLSSNEKNYLPMEKSVRTNLTRSSPVAETSQNMKTKSDGPSGVSVTRSIVKSSQNSRNKNKPNSEISKREAGQNFVDDENERSFLAGTPAVQSISRSEGGSRPASVNSFDTYSHSARGHEDVVSNSPYREIEIDRLDVHSERNSRAHESSYGTVSEPIGADMNDEYYGSGGDITLHESLASRSAITPMLETVSDGKNSSDNTYSWLASTSQTPESTITDFKTAKPETSLSTTESVAERDAMTPMERVSDYGDSEEDHDFLPTESRDVWSSEKNNKTELQTVPSTAESRSKVQSGSKASQRTMSLTEHMTEVSQANQSNRLYSEYTRRKQQKELGRNEAKSPDYTGRNSNSDFRSHSRSSSVLQTKTPSFGGSRNIQSSKDRTTSSLGTRNELETESRSRKKTESAATNDSSSFAPSASAVQTMTRSISNPRVNNSSKNSSLELKNDQLRKTNSEKDSTNIVRTVAFDEEPSGDGSITLRNDIDTDYQELAQGQRIKSSPNDTKADSNYNSYYYIRVPEEKSSEGKQSEVSFETSDAFSNTAVDSIPSGRSNRTKTTVYTKPFSPTSSDRISNIADLSHADSNDSDYNTLQVKTATSPKATKGPKTPRSSNLAMSPNPLKSPKTVKTSVVRPVNEEYPITPRNSFADQKSQRSQESLLSSRPGTPTPRIDIQSTTAPSRGRLESTGRRTQSQESIDEVEVEDEESMSGPQGAEWTEDVASSLPPSIQSGKTSSRKVNSDLANTVITEVSRKFIICSSSKKR